MQRVEEESFASVEDRILVAHIGVSKFLKLRVSRLVAQSKEKVDGKKECQIL
jgi:hypothetical protein